MSCGQAGSEPLPLLRLVDDFAAQYSYVANEGSRFVCHTNLRAPRYRSHLLSCSRSQIVCAAGLLQELEYCLS